MYALLRLFVRSWLWLVPERGRTLLSWEQRQHGPPNGRAAGRRGCAAAGRTSCSAFPGTLCAAEPAAAAAAVASSSLQHAPATSPGPLTRRRLLRLLSGAQDCPPLLHTWRKSLGWHRACPLAPMAQLEQAPGRAQLLNEEEEGGCGGAQDGCPQPGKGNIPPVREICPQAQAPPAGCALKSPEVVEGWPGGLAEEVPEVGGLSSKEGMRISGEGDNVQPPVAGSSLAPGAGKGEGDGITPGMSAGGQFLPSATGDSVAGCNLPPGVDDALPVIGGLDLRMGSEMGGSLMTAMMGSLSPGAARSLYPGVAGEGDSLGSEVASELGSQVSRDCSGVPSLAPEMGSLVQITVAIEAVDDDVEGTYLGALEGGGSCSEDDRNDKYSGAATSGGENDSEDLDPNWTPPEEELIQKLIVQIEYYLSDENLEKDAFLLKHVRRNKMGYVSVKLLTSFKKVKHLTRDWRTTAYALRFSDTLELNEDNRKIRRKSPVPVFPSENLPSKMLLVHDFHLFPELQALNKEQENGGMQEKIMEQLLKVFGSFGVISSVRILKPGRDLPPDVKRFSSRYAQVGTKECAIVEYEEVEAAIKAQETMGLVKENEVGMKVILIGMKPPKKKILKDKTRDEDSNKNRKAKSLNKRVEELQYTGDESPVSSSSDPDSNPTSPMVERKYKASNKLSPSTYQNNHLSPNASPRSSPWNSPSGQRKVGKISPLADGTSPEFPRKCMDYSSDSSSTPSSSPWVQRRRQAQTVTQEKSPVGSPMLGRKIQNADGLPLGVLRLPKGPDGTKGFHNGIERNKPMQNLEST